MSLPAWLHNYSKHLRPCQLPNFFICESLLGVKESSQSLSYCSLVPVFERLRWESGAIAHCAGRSRSQPALSAPGGSPEENSHAQPHPGPAQGHLGAEAGVGTPFRLLRWLGSTKRAEPCCAGKLHGQDSRPQPFVLTCGWGLYTLWSSTYNFLAGKTCADF